MAVRQMLVAGRYRLLEPVGAGGMGRVWLARDEMLDRDVAIKEIVPPDWMSEAEKDRLRDRTLREARSAARLNHPHVVRIYDVVRHDGQSWIVMEYIPSRSLHQVLHDEGPYDAGGAARIGLAVLDALDAAHRAGVLHRDVKPHNVLIGTDGRVVLTDFGLATFVDDGTVTAPGLIVGSPQYVSPERARDGASTVESDLWSLGATVYAAVEGRSPYARDTAMATLAALATEPPDPPVRAGPLTPILEGLLRFHPGDRLTAAEVEHRLRLIVAVDHREIPLVPGQRTVHHRPEEPRKPTDGAVFHHPAGIQEPDTDQLAPPAASRAPEEVPAPEPALAVPGHDAPVRGTVYAASAQWTTLLPEPAPVRAEPAPVQAEPAPFHAEPAPFHAEPAPDVPDDPSLSSPPEEPAADPIRPFYPPTSDQDDPAAREETVLPPGFLITSPAPISHTIAEPAPASFAATPGQAPSNQAPSSQAPVPAMPSSPPGPWPPIPTQASPSVTFTPGDEPEAAHQPPPDDGATTPLHSPRQALAPLIVEPKTVLTGQLLPPATDNPASADRPRWTSRLRRPHRPDRPDRPAGTSRPRRTATLLRRLPARRTTVAAALLILLSGSVSAGYLAQTTTSGPQVIQPPAAFSSPSAGASPALTPSRPATSASTPSPAGSATQPSATPAPTAPIPTTPIPTTPVAAPGGFSPIVCDSPPSANARLTPKKSAARGVNGWTLHAGWSYFNDGSGFHLAVPDGWTYQRIGKTYCFRDPHRSVVMSLDTGRDPTVDPIKACQAEDLRLQRAGKPAGYSLIGITPVPLLHKAADWDFRYRDDDGASRRASIRWFTVNGKAYALGWATPDKTWSEDLSRIQMVRTTFYADRTARPDPATDRR